MSNGPLFSSTPVAKSVPYDNTISGLAADEVQTAIDVAYNLAKNASRGALMCGFDGTASAGRWLEWSSNVASNLGPYVQAEPGLLRALSVGTASNATATITVFKNGVAWTSLTITANTTAVIANLNLSVTANDKLSVQVTSGSIVRPNFSMFIQTL